MTAAELASKRRWPLAIKAGILITLIGPLAGAVCMAIAMVCAFVFSSLRGGFSLGLLRTPFVMLVDALQSALGLVVLSYIFGIVPAAAAGLSVAAFVLRTGHPPGRSALLIGALMPPACLLAVGAFDPFGDRDSLWNEAKLAAAALALGLGAAFITSRLISRILRRDLAQV